MNKFSVIVDTREKEAWDFEFYEQCSGMVLQGLKEGDYTIKELLDLEAQTGRKILRIERKASTGEIAGNLGKKWPVFVAELKRLQEYEHKLIILEFTIDQLLQFPIGSGIPKRLWYRRGINGKMVNNIRMNGKYMLSRLREIEETYNIPVKYADGKEAAMDIAMEVFQTVLDANQEEIQRQQGNDEAMQ